MTRPIVTALLYASLALTAIPAAAAGLGDGLRAEIADLREGTMRKLVVHDTARQMGDVTYQTEDGGTVRLSDGNGKIRIVNFWATWCAPCREEKPALDRLNAMLEGPNFEVVAIATGRNSEASIKRFNTEFGIGTLATYLDPKSEAARAMGIIGLPVSVILDRDGNEIARLQGGAEWDSESAIKILERLIAAGS